MKDIKLKKLFEIINEETMTQNEVAKKQNITVRWVKEKTRKGELKAYKLKARTLYNKDQIINSKKQ